VEAAVDVVLYTDGTSEVSNQQMYRAMLARRQGMVLGLQKANELIAAALADPKEQHPTTTVTNQLKALDTGIRNKKLAMDDPENYETQGFSHVLVNLQHAPQWPAGRTPEEDKFLQDLVEHNSNRLAAMQQGVRP